jgi:hypothetical protein
MLRHFHDENTKYELSVDDVARGCLFGRLSLPAYQR